MTFLEPPIAVSLSQTCVGSIFITDFQVTDYYKQHPSQHAHLSPKVIFLSESPQFASLVSQEAINQIVRKESEFASHKTTESTNGFKNQDDYLLKSAMTLSHASSVAIVTWSPGKHDAVDVPEEQFAAVVRIVKALLAQEKEVTILATKGSAAVWQKFLVKCEAEMIIPKCLPVTSVAMTPNDGTRDVCSTMRQVVDYLGPRFRSTSLNSVIMVNEQGENQTRSLPLVTILFSSRARPATRAKKFFLKGRTSC